MIRLGRHKIVSLIKSFPGLVQDCPTCEEITMSETAHIFGTTSWHSYLDRLRELQVLAIQHRFMYLKLGGSDEKN